MVEPALFGPLDALVAPVIEYVVLVLVVANMGTRLLAHRAHVEQADSGADALSRHRLHEASNALLVLGSFYYLTLHLHAGTVLSVIVLGTVLADFFEFEGRQLELRQDWALERPKAALVGSGLALAYAAFQSLFFLVKPFWELIV
ncbi:MAG: hypothetical protein U5J98_12205 [Halobacteriales archaeon]|nr:hypothetical protein [Halobacteriales archaeon]